MADLSAGFESSKKEKVLAGVLVLLGIGGGLILLDHVGWGGQWPFVEIFAGMGIVVVFFIMAVIEFIRAMIKG